MDLRMHEKCMFKVSNRNTRTRFEICSKLTINTPERRQWFDSKPIPYSIRNLRVLKNLMNLSTINSKYERKD